MENYQYIVVFGNPADGFTHYGPFPDAESANDWAEDADGDWWLITLEEPK